MPLLSIHNLCRYFGGVKAVHNVSFDIESGSIQGLIGPNGSGKTTLFNCLTGIYKPTSGQIDFEGSHIDGLAPHKIVERGIARTFQNLRLFAGMTVLENVMVGRHRHIKESMTTSVFVSGTNSTANEKAVQNSLEILEFCGLKGREDNIAGALPYGLQRRVEIARALATEPKLILLDEPAAGMNTTEAAALKKLIVAIRDKGVTVFIIEHNVRLVLGLCDMVAVMDGGELIAFGDPNSIANNPKVIEAYLGRDEESDAA